MSSKRKRVLGDYRILETLAVGGMAEILLAERGEGLFKKRVVLKKMFPEFWEDPIMLKLFEIEAKVTLLLNHDNIVKAYRYGSVGDALFLELEYLDGLNLLNVLKKLTEDRVYLPSQFVIWIISEILRGLSYLHSFVNCEFRILGLVHRDISLNNIFVTRRGKIKIIDLGIVQFDQQPPELREVFGQKRYLSPEELELIDFIIQKEEFLKNSESLNSTTNLQLEKTPTIPSGMPAFQKNVFSSVGSYDSSKKWDMKDIFSSVSSKELFGFDEEEFPLDICLRWNNENYIDYRSDIYSLGIVFWELLTSQSYSGEWNEERLLRILQKKLEVKERKQWTEEELSYLVMLLQFFLAPRHERTFSAKVLRDYLLLLIKEPNIEKRFVQFLTEHVFNNSSSFKTQPLPALK